MIISSHDPCLQWMRNSVICGIPPNAKFTTNTEGADTFLPSQSVTEGDYCTKVCSNKSPIKKMLQHFCVQMTQTTVHRFRQ
jgi:hypothetical protein